MPKKRYSLTTFNGSGKYTGIKIKNSLAIVKLKLQSKVRNSKKIEKKNFWYNQWRF